MATTPSTFAASLTAADGPSALARGTMNTTPDPDPRTPIPWSPTKLFRCWVLTPTPELRATLLELTALPDREPFEGVIAQLRAELVHRAHPANEAAHVRWYSATGRFHDQALVVPDAIYSTDLWFPLVALFEWMARAPWVELCADLHRAERPCGHTSCPDCEGDDTPAGAGYQVDTGTPRPTPDTWATRPGVK